MKEENHENNTFFSVIVLMLALTMTSPSVLAAGTESSTGSDTDVLKASLAEAVGIIYHTHIQNKGWENIWAANGDTAGTEGQSLRLEGIQIKLAGADLPTGGQIEYRTHVQNNGWESTWASAGSTAGTEGQSLRLEAIEIRLLNMLGYSVQYRVHVQNQGWETAWSADGDSAGTEGRSLRLEAIEIRLVNIVSAPAGLTAKAGSSSISLAWNEIEGADSYTVYQAASMEGEYTEITTGLMASTYEVPNLEDGKRYYFKIKATADSTDSQQSDAVTAIASVDDQGNMLLGDRLLISNQSTAIENTQSTGSLIPSTAVLETAEYNQAPFAIDRILPFEPAEGQKPLDPNDPSVLRTSDVYEVNSTKDFYTANFVTNNMDQTHARLAYIGTHVQIWVDADDPKMILTDDHAQKMGEAFDNTIYPLVTENFYSESDVNGDGKIAILCYDIKDGYSEESVSFSAGYCNFADLYDGEESNKMEIFYVDTDPTMGDDANDPDLTLIYEVLSHEFQHMVNFNCTEFVKKSKLMSVWLNEGLSQEAQRLFDVSAEPLPDTYWDISSYAIEVYNTSDEIRNGRSLLDFSLNQGKTVSNYALSYLFVQYLRTQVDNALGSGNGIKIFNEIISDPGTETEAVEHIIQKYIDPNLTFGEFMTNFRAAMVLKADTGYFGFNDEDAFDGLSTPLYSGDTTNLSGGGAIVMAIDAPFTLSGDQGTDISYLGIFR